MNIPHTTVVKLLIATLLFTLTSQTALAEWQRHEIFKDTHVNSAVAVDLDGDKRKEIIFASDRKVYLYYGKNHEKHTIIAQFPKPLPLHKRKGVQYGLRDIHSCLMDVDRDGDLDFVGSNQKIYWLECPDRNPETNPWPFHDLTDKLFGSHCVRAFDIDKDGHDELIANNFKDMGDYPHSIVALKQPFKDGKMIKDAPWAHHVIADKDAMGGSHYFNFGDINGDGHIDMAQGSKGKPFPDGNYFSYYINQGDALKPWKKYKLPEYGQFPGASHAIPADVNGNGKPDIICTQGHGKGVLWFENKGTLQKPEWHKHMIDKEINSTHSTDVGDVDGDGDPDISTVGYLSKLAVWYENDGKGNFTRHVLSDNQEAYDTMIIDIDGDGHNDILIAGRGTKNVVWFRNPGK